MPSKKKYSKDVDFEEKLKNVMERLGAEEYRYDWSRSDTYIEFKYGGQWYKFTHSLQKAKDAGQKIAFVSDLFAQLVYTLEDIARMTERGIYHLDTWLEGVRMLPEPQKIPECFIALNFTDIPANADEVKKRFRELSKVFHPDAGGSAEAFQSFNERYQACLSWFAEKEAGEV